jgi:hypothetical protein
VTVRSSKLYCEKCCPACRAKKEIEHGRPK